MRKHCRILIFLASFASSNAFLWSVGDTGSSDRDTYTGHVTPIPEPVEEENEEVHDEEGMLYAPVHWVLCIFVGESLLAYNNSEAEILDSNFRNLFYRISNISLHIFFSCST